LPAPTESARPGTHLYLLHTPRLVLPDASVHVLTRKDAALLAFIVLEGASQPARLAALLWPETSAKQARTNLRQRLLRLRRTAGTRLVLSDATLRLVGDLPVDLAAAPQAIVDDPHACAGELLGSQDYLDAETLSEWVRGAREAWRQRRLELLVAQASRLEARGELARALLYAQRIVADEPLLEHGYRRQMRLHYLRGDRAAALASYERCVDILHRELGSAPADETREQATLIADAVATPVGPVRPLPDALRRPPQRVGREAAWLALQELSQRPAALLVVGDAGMGKTRLLGDFCLAHTAWCIGVARAGDDSAPYAFAARLLHALQVQCGPPALDPAHLAVLARLLPVWGTPGDGVLEPAALRMATEQALAHWAAAGLQGVVIDDVHFADAASLDLLLPLAGAAAQLGLGWLLAVRPAEMPVALTGWLERQRAPAFCSVHLAALDVTDVQALLECLRLGFDAPALWAQRLLAHCGGNPLYLLATLSELQARQPGAFAAPPIELPLPRSLAPLLEARLRQVSAQAIQVAQVTALAAQNFEVELVAAVLGWGVAELVEPWRQLEDANVFGGEGYSHALVREAVVHGIPAVVQLSLIHI
jgi:DNA-binding SARP family transcriptional activator